MGEGNKGKEILQMTTKYYPQVKGKSGKFEAWVEIPIDVYYEFQPAERATRHYPGCPASICITEVEFKGEALKQEMLNYTLKEHIDGLTQDAWEDVG